MNKRATSWLLATLLALCAAQAMPMARTQRTGERCPLVWVACARAEQRVFIERRALRPRMRIVVALPHASLEYWRLFSNPLYQRPPPSLG